jgi:hypothetical protein
VALALVRRPPWLSRERGGWTEVEEGERRQLDKKKQRRRR